MLVLVVCDHKDLMGVPGRLNRLLGGRFVRIQIQRIYLYSEVHGFRLLDLHHFVVPVRVMEVLIFILDVFRAFFEVHMQVLLVKILEMIILHSVGKQLLVSKFLLIEIRLNSMI